MHGDDFDFTQIETFKTTPEYYLEFVKAVEEQINSRFPMASLRTYLLRIHFLR
jgi:hypothetical protein